MSNIERLKRVVTSWVGGLRKKRRSSVYEQDDPRMIINDLGLQLSPEALSFIADSSFHREDMLMQIYAAEEELDRDLVVDNVRLDPVYSPKVYESFDRIAVTMIINGDEVVVFEFSRKEREEGS